MQIDPDQIRTVIGPGGKTINKIIEQTGVKIDIEDDGTVYIATNDEEAAGKAKRIVEGIAKDLQVGDVLSASLPQLGYTAMVRVADIITQREDSGTTRTIRLGTPTWHKT